MTKRKYFTRSLLIFALLFASLSSIMMVFIRAYYSGEALFGFLVWNLFLAWLPLLFSFLGFRYQRRRFLLLCFGFLWILFFPNAPYLVTDLIHLRDGGIIPLWYDAIMIFSFALTGLLLGLTSLFLMQSIVMRRAGTWVGWLFALAALLLSGYGVYVGRFLRWNSWDIIAHPSALMNDILFSLVHPQMMLKTYTVSLSLSAVFLFSYVVLFSLPRLALETKAGQ